MPLAHFGVQYVLLINRQLLSVLLFTIGLLQVGHNLINYDIAQIVELSYTHRVQKATLSSGNLAFSDRIKPDYFSSLSLSNTLRIARKPPLALRFSCFWVKGNGSSTLPLRALIMRSNKVSYSSFQYFSP